jgi:hypothetical protein
MKDELENEVNKKIELMQGAVLREESSKSNMPTTEQMKHEEDDTQIYDMQEEDSPNGDTGHGSELPDPLKEDTVRTEKINDAMNREGQLDDKHQEESEGERYSEDDMDMEEEVSNQRPSFPTQMA